SRDEAQDGPGRHGLARARLADDAELLPPHREADPPHRLDRPRPPGEPDPEVLDRQQRRRVGHGYDFRSRTSRSPSPTRLNPRLTRRIAIPGMVATPHWSRRNFRPEAIMAPPSGDGGWAPRPRKPSPAAVRMIPAMSRVRRTITEDRQRGMTWPRTMRTGP